MRKIIYILHKHVLGLDQANHQPFLSFFFSLSLSRRIKTTLYRNLHRNWQKNPPTKTVHLRYKPSIEEQQDLSLSLPPSLSPRSACTVGRSRERKEKETETKNTRSTLGGNDSVSRRTSRGSEI